MANLDHPKEAVPLKGLVVFAKTSPPLANASTEKIAISSMMLIWLLRSTNLLQENVKVQGVLQQNAVGPKARAEELNLLRGEPHRPARRKPKFANTTCTAIAAKEVNVIGSILRFARTTLRENANMVRNAKWLMLSELDLQMQPMKAMPGNPIQDHHQPQREVLEINNPSLKDA